MTAKALLAAGKAAVAQSVTSFDLAKVEDVDSSGLATVFGWMREAQAQGKTIRIVNPPKNLVSLADVYGVGDLLPL
jgi:phospholipid transport system transporter-binding protein